MASTEHSIATMNVGEQGWAVPWAIYHDKERNLWLNGAYELHDRPGGTVEMLVRRDEDGWHADATRVRGVFWGEGRYIGDFPPVRVTTFTIARHPGPCKGSCPK